MGTFTQNQVSIKWMWELPEKINGIAVVIDVLAATSNTAWFLNNRAGKLIIVNTKNIYTAKTKYPDAVLIGDDPQLGIKFDSSNRPSEVSQIDIKDRTILYLTNNGCLVVEMALQKQANQVITASLTNTEVVVGYLQNFQEPVILIPAGERTIPQIPDYKAQEDLICAKIIQDLLLGIQVNWKMQISNLQNYIRDHYLYNEVTRNKDLLQISAYNTNQIVPLCTRSNDGLIYVNNIKS